MDVTDGMEDEMKAALIAGLPAFDNLRRLEEWVAEQP